MVKKFSISINDKILGTLDEIAEMEERSRNWLINKAIEQFIERYGYYEEIDKEDIEND